MWKVSSKHGIEFFSWTHFSFRFDNTVCRDRREFRSTFEYQLSRPKLVEKAANVVFLTASTYFLLFWENEQLFNLTLTHCVFVRIKGQIDLSVLLFSPCFRPTTFVANSFHNMDWECDFQSFSYNSGTPWYRKPPLFFMEPTYGYHEK